MWTSAALANSALTTLQDVLVHQRARWGALLAHQHQYEGWWKAEFALALESWCFRLDLPEPTRIWTEAKPRDHGIGQRRQFIDILIARWSVDKRRAIPEPPRVWIELKERGTWWGNARKALCEDGRSLWTDLHKWKETRWLPGEVVVACQIISHEAEVSSSEPLPVSWREVLDTIDQTFPRYLPPRSVGHPCVCPRTGKSISRFVTIEFFTIQRG